VSDGKSAIASFASNDRRRTNPLRQLRESSVGMSRSANRVCAGDSPDGVEAPHRSQAIYSLRAASRRPLFAVNPPAIVLPRAQARTSHGEIAESHPHIEPPSIGEAPADEASWLDSRRDLAPGVPAWRAEQSPGHQLHAQAEIEITRRRAAIYRNYLYIDIVNNARTQRADDSIVLGAENPTRSGYRFGEVNGPRFGVGRP